MSEHNRRPADLILALSRMEGPTETVVKEEQEIRAWVLGTYGAPAMAGQAVKPADVQRAFRLPYNRAASILEALERDGELVKAGGVRRAELAWAVAPAPSKVGRSGYQLPLSQKEHGALLAGLTLLLEMDTPGSDYFDRRVSQEIDDDALRAIRSRMKRPV